MGACRGKDVAEASPNTMRAAAAAAAPFEAGEDGGAAEHMLMVALETLFKDAAEVDVQLGLLRVVLQILQRHGVRPVASILCVSHHPVDHHLHALSANIPCQLHVPLPIITARHPGTLS